MLTIANVDNLLHIAGELDNIFPGNKMTNIIIISSDQSLLEKNQYIYKYPCLGSCNYMQTSRDEVQLINQISAACTL
jgi:hypothetical protein